MEQRLNFVTLVVADLETTKRFYVDGLGWTPSMDVPNEVVMIQVGERLVLSLWSEQDALKEIGPVTRAGTLPFTLAHNVETPAEVDYVLATAANAGATIKPAEQRDWGGYSGYFLDPDGVHWEVAFNPHAIGTLRLP